MHLRPSPNPPLSDIEPMASQEWMGLAKLQIIRKYVLGVTLLIGLLLLALTASIHPSGSPGHEIIKWVGIAAIMLCILGRTWCTLYIGGHKGVRLVSVGPYSVSRNPLYFFSILGAAGVGVQHGSVLAGAIFCTVTWLVFYFVVLQEERILAGLHGAEFETYMKSVPRFLPNPQLWCDVPTVTVTPSSVIRTFGDGLFFLIPIPLTDVFEWLQRVGILPVLAHLY